jgi:hypothetical protein
MIFDQRNHFGDFSEYLFSGIPAGDPDVVIPNPLAIVERLGRPEGRALGLRHLPVLLPDEIVDAGLSYLSRIERAEALVDFRAQGAQLFDMGEQCPPDLFLILGRQTLHFGDGLFKCFDHEISIPNRSRQNSSVYRISLHSIWATYLLSWSAKADHPVHAILSVITGSSAFADDDLNGVVAARATHYPAFRTHTLLSWNAAPPNGAMESAPVSVLMPRPSA